MRPSVNSDYTMIECLSGPLGKYADMPVEAEGAAGGLSRKPPVDVGRIADWLNKNHNLIKAKNYLHQDPSYGQNNYMSKRSTRGKGFGATGYSSQG